MDLFGSRGPAVVGHRGAPAMAPENTPVSFACAAEAGADWLELDVRRCADGLVVHHDPRTADGRAVVAQAADDLAALGVWSFAAVLEALPEGLGVDVEVKNIPGEPDFDEAEHVAHAVAELLQRRVGERAWMTSSFSPLTVEALASALPDVPVGFVHYSGLPIMDGLGIATAHGARIVCPQVGAPGLDGEGIAAAHDAGLSVLVWTVDDVEEAISLARAGVDAICTNDPALLAIELGRLCQGYG